MKQDSLTLPDFDRLAVSEGFVVERESSITDFESVVGGRWCATLVGFLH